MSPRRRADHGRRQGPDQAVGAAQVDGQDAVERLGVGVEDGAGDVQAGVGHQDLDRRRGLSTAALANCVHRVAVGQVEVDGDRLAAVGPDGRGRRPRTRSTRRAPEGHRVAGAARARAVAWPMPEEAPVTTAGRRSGWGSKRGISAGVTVVGRAARPRTLMEWTRSMPVGVDVVGGHPRRPARRGRRGPRAGPGGRPCRSGGRCRS